MAGILLDTSVYIDAFRTGNLPFLLTRSVQRKGIQVPVWLSSVVLAELYAGAAQPKARKLIEALEYDHFKINRLLVPNRSDWVDTGKLLNKLGNKYGFENIGKGRITNDTLISISAARQGIHVLTSNAKDFARIAEFSELSWEII